MSEHLIEVKRQITLWYGPKDGRKPLILKDKVINRVPSEVMQAILNDPQQGPVVEGYMQLGEMRIVQSGDAQNAADGKRALLEPSLTPAEKGAINVGKLGKLGLNS